MMVRSANVNVLEWTSLMGNEYKSLLNVLPSAFASILPPALPFSSVSAL